MLTLSQGALNYLEEEITKLRVTVLTRSENKKLFLIFTLTTVLCLA